MKIKIIILAILLIGLGLTIGYQKLFLAPQKQPYRTERAQRRTIKRIIETTGKTAVCETIKIGSLESGIVTKIYVEENQHVKAGTLLTVIDTGKDDTDVRAAQGVLDKATANYHYYKSNYLKQKELYKAGQLSKDAFESIERTYLSSKGDYDSAVAQLEQAERFYKSTKITTPQEGVVISIEVTEGEGINTQLNASVLFKIAKDVTKMEAKLELDESSVCHVKPGQRVEFTVDAFPHKKFKSTINEIAYSPTEKKDDDKRFYIATILIDNSEKLLRPGLAVNAKIFVAKAKNALTLPSQAFMVNAKILEEIAKKFHYAFMPTTKQERKTARKALQEPKLVTQEQTQTVWVVQNGGEKSFVEKIVTTNLTDDVYYEITSGLAETDEVIVDVEEADYMEEIYKKIFKSSF